MKNQTDISNFTDIVTRIAENLSSVINILICFCQGVYCQCFMNLLPGLLVYTTDYRNYKL